MKKLYINKNKEIMINNFPNNEEDNQLYKNCLNPIYIKNK